MRRRVFLLLALGFITCCVTATVAAQENGTSEPTGWNGVAWGEDAGLLQSIVHLREPTEQERRIAAFNYGPPQEVNLLYVADHCDIIDSTFTAFVYTRNRDSNALYKVDLLATDTLRQEQIGKLLDHLTQTYGKDRLKIEDTAVCGKRDQTPPVAYKWRFERSYIIAMAGRPCNFKAYSIIRVGFVKIDNPYATAPFIVFMNSR